MKKETPETGNFIKKQGLTIIVLILAVALFFMLLNISKISTESVQGDEYVEYEKGTVVSVMSDSTEQDEASDNAYRGEQMLIVKVESGQYKGEELLTYNFVGPLYSVPVAEGDGVTLMISTYANGDHNATVYEYNRIPALGAIIVIFFIVAALVGGKTGIKSLIGLGFTILCLFLILIPLLLKGYPTIPTTFAICAYISLVSFTILGGVQKKTVSAFLGTISGTALATVFGLLAQHLTKMSGLRLPDMEALLQLRQGGMNLGLRGLLVAGIIISALGAVMDVAMSISSALEEVHAANPALTVKELFISGMNIGRDMVGTMTNTLILAFLGSGFTIIIYLYSLGLSFYQLFSSAYASTEVISGVASSIGMILAIPLTALIASTLIVKGKDSRAQ